MKVLPYHGDANGRGVVNCVEVGIEERPSADEIAALAEANQAFERTREGKLYWVKFSDWSFPWCVNHLALDLLLSQAARRRSA